MSGGKAPPRCSAGEYVNKRILGHHGHIGAGVTIKRAAIPRNDLLEKLVVAHTTPCSQ